MFVKIDSWHEIEAGTSSTLCGLDVDESAPRSDALPMAEKSCESCLRLARHATDTGASGAAPEAKD
jgi:hypothetical protein